MNILPSDTVFNHLKGRGLLLSPITKVQIPKPLPPSQTFYSLVSSFFVKRPNNLTHTPHLLPILNSAFLLATKNTLHLYTYKINENADGPFDLTVPEPQSIPLTNYVLAIFTCDNKYVQDRGDVPIAVQTSAGVYVFVYDSKEMLLKEKHFLKVGSITGIGFLSQKEILVLSGCSQLYLYLVNSGIRKGTLQLPLNIGSDEKLLKTWIMGNADQQQDTTIVIFYAVANPEERTNKKIKLRVKQFTRTLDGGLQTLQKSDFEVPSNNLDNHSKLQITNVEDYYCVQMPKEVLILKKKFDKYMFLDNMMEKINGYSVYLNSKGLIASVGPKLMELNCVHFGDPKCQSRICDTIEFQNQQISSNYKNFKEIWPILIKKQYSLIFVFLKQDALILTHLVKREAKEKLLDVVKKMNQKTDSLNIVKDMAQNMGISRKQFYLLLWSKSQKTNIDIYKYLLPCHHVPSIKRQLKSTLRRRTIKVIEMNRILEKMNDILCEILKTDLNQTNLKEFVKNDFLRRKINLNLAEKELDHTIFDKIYSSSLLNIFEDIITEALFYKEPKTDPMNSMADKVEKQNKSMEKVFQEFKVLILQDYKEFLISLFERKKEFQQEITTILTKYPFLLPNFPFKIQVQRPSKINKPIQKDPNQVVSSQQVWFQTVTLQEWSTQLTKQRIMKLLHFEYQTSKLNETIDEFIHQYDSKGQKKRHKHGLISVSLDQFIQKIDELNGINLYLDICQYANEKAIQNGKPQNSRDILKILQKNNKLSGEKLEQCKLYASMHYFMRKNQISLKNPLKIQTLKNLSEENLLALFFLENKQRKEFIFQEFMELYDDKAKFINLLAKFVQSENCSRIQLQILMKEMIERGHDFQRKNQEIIQLLIMGVCTKLQIRESLLILDSDQSDEGNQESLIDDIDVSKDLALTINRIKQLKKCRDIFINFKCEKMTYQELINLEKNRQIFRMFLNKYFNDDFKSETLTLDGEEIVLNSPTSLLTVMLYLQQNVYYEVQTEELLNEYGLFMIDWKQFDSIKELLYQEDDILTALDIDKMTYAEKLIQNALENIYMDPEIVYDGETREQILNILNILQSEHPIKIRQIAKLNLVTIFQSWDISVHPSDIQTICTQCQNEDETKEFFKDLFGRYIDNLTFEVFKAIYQQLRVAVTQRKQELIDIIPFDYIELCLLYAGKLMQKQRFPQTIQVLTFVKNVEDRHNTYISFDLLSEAFLKSLISIYKENEDDGRRMIDFFIQNNVPDYDYKIKNLFQSNFDEAVLSLWERENQIHMNEHYFYKNAKGECIFQLDDAWTMAKSEAKNPSETFYNYYFLATGLRQPRRGFANIKGISYNLQQITNIILIKLEFFISQNKSLWIINYDELLKEFKSGLMDMGKSRLPHIQKSFDIKLERVIDSLKEEREKNAQLIKSLTRVKQQWRSKMKKEERKNRFLNLMDQIRREEEERRKKGAHIEPQPQPVVEQQQIFMTWKFVDQQRIQISQTQKSFMTDRDIINQIYTSMEEQPRKNKHEKSPSFIEPVLPAITSIEEIQPIILMIRNEDYENAKSYPVEMVRAAFDVFYTDNQQLELDKVVDILESLNIGDGTKINMFKLTKFFQGSVEDEDIHKLFPVEFFLKPVTYSEDEKYSAIYEELKPTVQELVKRGDALYIRDLAKMFDNILESSEFGAWVYYQALIFIGGNLDFISDSALLSQDCIVGLKEYPDIIPNNYKSLLNSFQKDKQMRLYVRQNLAKIMKEKGMLDVAEDIRNS